MISRTLSTSSLRVTRQLRNLRRSPMSTTWERQGSSFFTWLVVVIIVCPVILDFHQHDLRSGHQYQPCPRWWRAAHFPHQQLWESLWSWLQIELGRRPKQRMFRGGGYESNILRPRMGGSQVKDTVLNKIFLFFFSFFRVGVGGLGLGDFPICLRKIPRYLPVIV